MPVQYSLSIGPATVLNDPTRRFSRSFTSFFLKVFTPHKMLFLFSSNFAFLLSFWKHQKWVNVQFAPNKNFALEVYGFFAVYHFGFSSKQFQSCNKSLINQACSGPYWENIGPWSFLYGPRADILPVWPWRLVNT